MRWETALTDYKIYLRLERGLSENSIASYGYDIQRFIDFI
ncbi:site-specific integrase, partial [Flavobacteriaceae bacterium]|nr:site-specific integrase [Flavobacteriaceae bacterium]